MRQIILVLIALPSCTLLYAANGASGETFDLSPTEDRTVREKQDPRPHTDPDLGRRLIEEAVEEVRAKLLPGAEGR